MKKKKKKKKNIFKHIPFFICFIIYISSCGAISFIHGYLHNGFLKKMFRNIGLFLSEIYSKYCIPTYKDSDTFFKIAENYANKEDSNKAIENYHECLKINVTNITAYLKLANVLIKINSYKEATNYLDKLLSIEPNTLEAYPLIETCYIKNNERLAGIEYLNEIKNSSQINHSTEIEIVRIINNLQN